MGFTSKPTAIILKDINGKNKEFLIDASISINTSLRAKVTSYPVEDKGFISDHVQPEPLRIKIDGIISQSPESMFLSIVNAALGHIASQVSSLRGLSSTFATAALSAGVAGLATQGNQALDKKASYVKLLSNRGTVDNEYPKRAMQGLIAMFNDGVPFKIRTYFSNVLYDNMVATSLTFPQNARTGDSLRFSMECVKIQTVEKKFEIVKGELKMSDPAGSSAALNKDQGSLVGKKGDVSASKNSGLDALFGSK